MFVWWRLGWRRVVATSSESHHSTAPLPSASRANTAAEDLRKHTSCCVFQSRILSINSSVAQRSVLGPSSFIINASSLKPVNPLNKRIKFADDIYLVIPSSNSNSLQLELDSLSEWAKLSNLSPNFKKSYELIIHNNYNKITPPCLHPSLQRTSSLTILGA